MVYDSLHDGEEKAPEECLDPTRGVSLVLLSLATSMDALGVGFGIGIVGESILLPALIIGVVAGIMTFSAMQLGNRISRKFGKRMGIIGGVILMVIAFKILIS